MELNAVGAVVKEGVGKLSDFVKHLFEDGKIKEWLNVAKDFFNQISENLNKDVVFGKEVDEVNTQIIVSFVKDYIVKGSNEVVVIKVKEEDCYYLYLAFAKDRELLPKEKNKYLIIKSKTISSELESMFDESDFLILK